MASSLAAYSVRRNEERRSACCPAIVPQARARYIRRMVDHADTLHHYFRILRPDALEGCVREHRFAPPRRWRFDLAWPAERLAVEVDGGRWQSGGGRHATAGDYVKLRAAVTLGWRVLRFTSGEVTSDPQSCIDEIIDHLIPILDKP